MAALVRPPSPPPSAVPLNFVAETVFSELGEFTHENREEGTRNGCGRDKVLHILLHQKVSLCTWSNRAKRAALTNLPLQRRTSDRRIIDANVASETPWNFMVSFISKRFQPQKVTISVRNAQGRRAATGSPLMTFLYRSSLSGLSVFGVSCPVITTCEMEGKHKSNM